MGLTNALAGGFGLIRNEVEFYKTDFDLFVRDLPPGSVVNTSARKPGFFAGGIRAVTGMPWDHSLMYVGKSAGEMIRKARPELMGKRTVIFQGKEKTLRPIPVNAGLHEIVESDAYVEVNPLDKYNNDNNSMEAWSRPYTQQQLEQVLFDLYLMHGMPYDVGEIGAHIGLLPNTTKENCTIIIKTERSQYTASIRVCSSLMSRALWSVETIPNGEQISPGGLHKYFKKTPHWSRRLFNTRPGK